VRLDLRPETRQQFGELGNAQRASRERRQCAATSRRQCAVERLEFGRLEPRDFREPFAEAIEPHDPRLQFAEVKRHRIEVALHELLRLERFLPLVREHDSLQPRMLD